MPRTTMGRLLVNQALPEDMRDDNRVLDKKGINQLLRELAEKHPDKYVEVSKKLSDIGRTAAMEFGGYTFGLEHLRTSAAAKTNRLAIQKKMQQILGNDDLTPEQRKQLIVKTVGSYQQKQIDDIYDEAVKSNNPIAMQVVSGSRGNKMNLGSLLGGDMLYSDHRDEVIPLPVLSSYSEGLKPMEYWAGMYGARRGTMATKFATQDAGFLSKQLNQVSHRLMVVGEEDERDIPDRGLPVDTDDGDNEGALLAKDIGPYKRNTVLTPKILKHIKGLGHDRILVRSPLVGGSPDGGVYARDVGVRERGLLPGRGEQVGLTAAQALSEPLAQGQLSAKHSGGVAGQEKAVGGFAYINQLIQVPKVFKGGAVHSEHDGTVSIIEPAPAGGSYVWVDDKRHYVPADAELKVKKGDAVEAGDTLTSGFPNPAIITEHKGVGEGKRYFVNTFRQAMRDAGMRVDRRNVELLARGLINHVKLTDEYGDHVPDDVVPYSTMEHLYEPREGHEVVDPKRAVGKYLERPVLHYSIGTKVRPSVLKELQHFGVQEVAVHKDPAPFQSNMIRGMYSLQHDPDWMTRMYGSGLKASLLDATHHGAISDELGTSFVPGLARAVDFGRVGAVRPAEPGYKLPPEGQPFGDPRATPKPTQALDVPQPQKKQEQPKPAASFSGLFKRSKDELIAEAHMFIKRARLAAAPKVDTTTPASMGSSTAAPSTATRNPVAAPPAAHTPSYLPGGGLPHAPQGPLASNTPQPTPAAPAPQAPVSGPPGTPTTPAAPGQIHPGRLAPGMLSENPWARGLNDNSPNYPQAGQANGSATQGDGLFTKLDSPEMAAQFVAGGGDPQRPGSGFGGDFGDVARFGSLLSQGDVATLTNQGKPLPGETSGERDSLMGYDDAIVPNYKPNLSIMPKTPAPPALPALPASNVQGMTHPDALKRQFAQTAGWQPGNAEFDAVKQTLGANATDAEVQAKMFDLTKRGHLLAKNGYVAGQPKFEEVRAKLRNQVVETIGGDVDKAIVELHAIVTDMKANNPAHPDIAKAEQQLKDLQQFKTKGISDDEVMQHLKQNVQPEGDISDYELLQEARGDNTWWRKSLGAFASPVTSSAFSRIITNPVIKPTFRGLQNLATKVPVLNKVPGFRNPIVKKLEDAATSRFGRGLGAAMKGFPLVGTGMEIYRTMNTPEDELRAKFEHKMKPTESLLGWADNRLDDLINPGQNIGAAATVAGDATGTHFSSEQQARQTDWTQAAHANALVQHLQQTAQRRALLPEEQATLAKTQKIVQDMNAKYAPTGFWDKAFGGNRFADDYRAAMTRSQHSAIDTLRAVKAQRGGFVVDQVLNNTANAADVDDFNAWLQTKLEPLHMAGVRGSLKDTTYQQSIDARIAELQPVLDKATKAGNTALAAKISDAIARAGRTPEERAARNAYDVKPAAPTLPAGLQLKPGVSSPFATPYAPPPDVFSSIPGLTPPAAGIGGFKAPSGDLSQRLESLVPQRQRVGPSY